VEEADVDVEEVDVDVEEVDVDVEEVTFGVVPVVEVVFGGTLEVLLVIDLE
jgi:hypothetical protein